MWDKMYQVSVIIPFYNGESHFKESFKSMKNQSIGFENIEVIFVNDCSKDSSPLLAKEYSEKYENCKFVDLSLYHSKNSGFPGRPRNYGLKEATAEYIIFYDIDDCYHPKAFEKLLNTIKSENSDLIIGNYSTETNNGSIKNTFCKTKKDLINVNPLKNQKTFDKISNITFISSWGKLFKKSIIKKNNLIFIEDGPVEDADFYFKYLLHAKTVTILPHDYLYFYNEYSDSTIHRHDKKLLKRYLKGFKRICEFMDKNYTLSYDLFYGDYLSNLLLIFINTKGKRETKIELLKEINTFEENKEKIDLGKPEINLLNNLIKKRKFKRAILLSKVYDIMYNNQTIKKIYRNLNNSRRNIK